MTAFDDILSANAAYAEHFTHGDVTAPAARGLAVLTCMDSRIDPLRALGLVVGDFKMLRNAGGRLTDDMRHNIVLSSHVLNVNRVLIMPHTQCAMAMSTDEQLSAKIAGDTGLDTTGAVWHTVPDQQARLAQDVADLRADPLLKAGTVVAGAIYDVKTGRIEITVPE